MAFDSQMIHLLDRCLRLEAQLLGVALDPPPDPLRAALRPPRPARNERRRQRRVTSADIAQMRDLRARGLSYHAIAQRVIFGATTVRTYVRDVQVAR